MPIYNITGEKVSEDYISVLSSGEFVYDGQPMNVRKCHYDEIPGVHYGAHGQSSYIYRQDAALYNGVLFQAITGNNGLENMIAAYDHATGNVISTFSCPVSHGSSLCFSDEKYSDSDEFPLLYCSVESPTIKINVLRVTRTSGELVRTLTLVDDVMVRNIVVAVDPENHKMITSWNKGGHYGDISIAECHVISVWDLDSLTQGSAENEYRAKLIDQYEVPFIACQQGCCFLNGIVYILSSGDATWRSQYNLHTAWVYLLDPYARRFVGIMKNFTKNTAEAENEAIVPAFDEESGMYFLEVIPLRGDSVYLEFSQ